MELRDLFVKGEYFPLPEHEDRIERYRRNDKLVKGEHYDVFQDRAKNELYISANFSGLIVRKGADFLVGERPVISSGKADNSSEQEALDRFVEDNRLHRLLYQTALQCGTKGDAFVKIRFGQEYNGAFPEDFDKRRIIIEGIDARKVYPQTSPLDDSKIVVYHIAEAIQVDDSDHKYQLYVESHYAGKIVYRRFELNVFQVLRNGEITTFKIGNELPEFYEEELTGVPVPLVVHFANYNDGASWEGQDDISEHIALFDEINNRLSQIAMILDKHADPAIAVPTGLLQEDNEGNTYFQIALNKVFEVMGKDDIIPQYVTNDNPQVDQAMNELDKIIDFLMSTAEIPHMAIGLKDAGTSGNSGLAIKFRMNSLLAKINRKKQFFEDSMKRVLMIAQMLEQYANPADVDYELTVPVIKFKNGLPQDETDVANRMAIRTNGSQTLSRKTALMVMDGLTEEQADEEIKRIEDEKKQALAASMDVFNQQGSNDLEVNKVDNRFDNYEDDEPEVTESKEE